MEDLLKALKTFHQKQNKTKKILSVDLLISIIETQIANDENATKTKTKNS